MNYSMKINNNSLIEYNIISKSNFDDSLKYEIILIAGSFIKVKYVPGDGDCGGHALRVCLRYHINIIFIKQY